MSLIRQRFGDFVLDPANRTLRRGDAPIALNARYFDALALLVREHGRLVPKQRFFDEVWTGSVVTDAALTQCIKEIRRVLGDDAADPRFVRTVAGHGYSFIAPVTEGADGAIGAAPASDPVATRMPRLLADAIAATIGGGVAGLLGGILYGSMLAFAPQAEGIGTISVLLVLVALNMLVGLAGALGVGLGLAGGRWIGRGAGWTLAGGALGGFLVGGVTKLLGSDAFTLLVGHAPSGITGGLEGAAIGFAIAAGWLLGGGPDAPRGQRPVVFAALATAGACALMPFAGGSLMASSLARVAAAFDHSRIDLAPLARLFGGPELGLVAQASLGALEGGIFGGCVIAALVLARRHAPPR